MLTCQEDAAGGRGSSADNNNVRNMHTALDMAFARSAANVKTALHGAAGNIQATTWTVDFSGLSGQLVFHIYTRTLCTIAVTKQRQLCVELSV